MKREKSLWTDCFAFPKTNSCSLLSGLNEPNPLGHGAGPWGMHRLSAGVPGLTFNQGGGKREASIQGIILINFIQAAQHPDCSFFPPGFQIYVNTDK